MPNALRECVRVLLKEIHVKISIGRTFKKEITMPWYQKTQSGYEKYNCDKNVFESTDQSPQPNDCVLVDGVQHRMNDQGVLIVYEPRTAPAAKNHHRKPGSTSE